MHHQRVHDRAAEDLRRHAGRLQRVLWRRDLRCIRRNSRQVKAGAWCYDMGPINHWALWALELNPETLRIQYPVLVQRSKGVDRAAHIEDLRAELDPLLLIRPLHRRLQLIARPELHLQARESTLRNICRT